MYIVVTLLRENMGGPLIVFANVIRRVRCRVSTYVHQRHSYRSKHAGPSELLYLATVYVNARARFLYIHTRRTTASCSVLARIYMV